MTWDVRLWCNECSKVIGTVSDVSTGSATETVRLEHVRSLMRLHEVEYHGGKS